MRGPQILLHPLKIMLIAKVLSLAVPRVRVVAPTNASEKEYSC